MPGSNDDNIESVTVHGVGVAEHVADMAPGAEIHCIMVGDELDLENAADYMSANGISIANHSVGWVTASYYDDTGSINNIINDSRDVDGVFWTVSAGNSANRHWRGVGWQDDDNDGWYNFTPSDEAMSLTSASSTIQTFLNWDQYGNSVTDLDFYIFDKNLTIVASSEAPQTGVQQPAESIAATYDSALAPYGLAIRHFAGPTANLDMTIFSFNNNLQYADAASSLMDPANAHGAYTVAAIDQQNWNLPNPPAESFSSKGPTNDGRQKPDITGPDGTSSASYGFQGSFGTSLQLADNGRCSCSYSGRRPHTSCE